MAHQSAQVCHSELESGAVARRSGPGRLKPHLERSEVPLHRGLAASQLGRSEALTEQFKPKSPKPGQSLSEHVQGAAAHPERHQSLVRNAGRDVSAENMNALRRSR